MPAKLFVSVHVSDQSSACMATTCPHATSVATLDMPNTPAAVLYSKVAASWSTSRIERAFVAVRVKSDAVNAACYPVKWRDMIIPRKHLAIYEENGYIP